mgnify:CR=1 FL=1
MSDLINFGIKGVGSSVRFGRRNGQLNFDNSADSFKFRNIADDGYAKIYVGTPTSSDQATNKSYVDQLIEGLTIKDPARVASNALTATDASISGAVSDVANISYNSTGDGGNGIITVTGTKLDSTSLAVNDRVLIDDGKIALSVIATNNKDTVKLKVVFGEKLLSNKGVNLPNTKISLPCLTKKDKKDLAFILNEKIEWIGLSFVRSANDVRMLKKRIKKGTV